MFSGVQLASLNDEVTSMDITVKYKYKWGLGHVQVVRQRVLVPGLGSSNPSVLEQSNQIRSVSEYIKTQTYKPISTFWIKLVEEKYNYVQVLRPS